MALPPTGSTIRLYGDISVYFSGPSSNVALGFLGTYIGIATGNQISMSSSFGGFVSQLYSFTDATFTPGTKTGPDGPSLTEARAGLTSTGSDSWKNNTSYFNVSSGIQLWTVPETGTYRIEAWGAQGGTCTTTGEAGGLGARMRGDFSLTQGQIIYILVGQRGQGLGYTAGGGGGSFVATGSSIATATALLVAGGGGGGGNSGGVGRPGVTGNNGDPAQGYGGTSGVAGTSGNGGSGTNGGWGESGAGFLSNSTSTKSVWGTTRTASSILSFRNGGLGAAPWPASTASSCVSAGGGFGGGGGGGCNGGGGGGGYSGGAGGGGGAGSFNTGTTPSNSSNIKSGNGQVTITKL
jgi:hypothetical protein